LGGAGGKGRPSSKHAAGAHPGTPHALRRRRHRARPARRPLDRAPLDEEAPPPISASASPDPDHAGIAAAAGGAFARTVRRASELDAALDAVHRDRRAAVLDVQLPAL
jgi:acetolactate synthase-1/2/3 large subunit